MGNQGLDRWETKNWQSLNVRKLPFWAKIQCVGLFGLNRSADTFVVIRLFI
ncbi:hypothetical protein PM8797T_05140 [Gimesia maris DSM 8797]|nr:hypothetical protein PM8797T_05140 [Gimesia maris DSM 8797]